MPHRRPPPPPCPPSWTLGPPDYVGVGALKAGTTWWAKLIAAHPAVRRHPLLPKELRFFRALWDSNDSPSRLAAEYHRHFPRPPGAVTGEWTPDYMHSFWVPPLLAEVAPDAKILVLLRDPIQRFRSELTQAIRLGRARDRMSQNETLNRVFNRGLYFAQLSRLFAVFQRQQVLVLQLEQCIIDPVDHLERTYAFIGVDPDFRPHNISQARNRTTEEKIRLNPHQEQGLREAYCDDVRRLGELVPDVDLSLWPGY